MNRTPQMQKALDDISTKLFGRNETTHPDQCVTCGSQLIANENFSDELSYKEFTISHMCQACQNEVFNEAK